MKLLFSRPPHSTLIFPYVGEWRSGVIKDVPDEQGEELLKVYGLFLRKVPDEGQISFGFEWQR
jgi:hypothetical protein